MRGVRAVTLCLLAALALSGRMRRPAPLGTALSPGDTVLVGERWF
jgi:hypothetical protein